MDRSGRTVEDSIDLTGFTSDESDGVLASPRRPTRPNQSSPPRRQFSLTHLPISPPALGRPSSSGRPSLTAGEHVIRPQNSAAAATSRPYVWRNQYASQEPGNQHVPPRMEWTTDKIEESLRALSGDVGIQNARQTYRLLLSAWKAAPTKTSHVSKKNWFADMKPMSPVEPGNDTLKMKLKASLDSPFLTKTVTNCTQQVSPGRGSKQEKREHYQVQSITTDKEAVMKYDFHHVHISKNILSPNTMVGFVPHLRDLQDHEEPKYRHWLKELESMDKISGFSTLSREDKVRQTLQKERASALLPHLDTWLKKLSIDGCSKSALVQHMASQTDAVTPQQKSSILQSYGDGSDSRLSKVAASFTEAFDRVFNDEEREEEAVSLRDVLLLDESVDSVIDPKKNLKDTPSQVKHSEEGMTVESFLEIYSLLGCMICSSHSCEHGEYGAKNERQRFSLDVDGFAQLIHQKSIASARGTREPSSTSCGQDCYLNQYWEPRDEPWSDKESIMLLKTAVALLGDTGVPIPCLASEFIGRPCWDVNVQLQFLDLQLPSDLPAPLKRPKPVPWYDRHKKMLIGDWEEQTITHEHQKKDHLYPCSHDGPCTKETCDCARNDLLCERFCQCTAETCVIKFTGCACHSLGRTCLPRSKGEKPCICVQLNRECDPALCKGCGAIERADPRNADDDYLHSHGCQNCALQRGKSKSLMVGKSTIEGCGYGLFTTEDVQQGDFVVEYVGELISQDEGVRREARRGDPFDNGPKSSYLFTLLDKEGIWVDAAIYGNLSRFINHQENDEEGGGPNIMPQIVYSGGEYRIKFTASREIRAGDELFFDYGKEFPNLTKKMLDEKNAEEVNKRRSHSEEVAQEPTATTSEPAPKSGRKRRGRPRKTPRDAYREEAAEASDTSSTDLISRRRVKKRPARYDD